MGSAAGNKRSRALGRQTALLLARIPSWLWERLLAEADRRGEGYWRIVNHALERELLHTQPAGQANDENGACRDE